ncbi:MAG TPA: hypothetical protein VF815_03345 [Myxococcaceae bacterium]|jgi:hypothetical protein
MASCGGDGKQPQPPPPPPPPPPATYKIGGTITGLSGSLTLQLNGAENLVRTADGAFTFQTEIEEGSAYTVALTASPAEQECTLQGATGTVSGADVTSIRVTCATRTYTIGGTVEGLNGTLALSLDGGETLSVTTNGPFTFQARRAKGADYTITAGTAPRGFTCTVLRGSGKVEGNVDNVLVQCTGWFNLTTFQAAIRVIGQSDFTSRDPHQGSVASFLSLEGPWGNPVFAGGKLYVSDRESNRLMGFNGLPTQNGAPASFVLGQPDFASTTGSAGRDGLSRPAGGASDGTRLAVADRSNSRVLLYDSLPSSTGAQPDRVLGQPDFSTTSFGCSATKLTLPEDVFLGHGKLVVADSSNNRVLVWNSVTAASGTAADLVLGQPSFTTCAANDTNGDGTQDSAPSAATFFDPSGVWTDGTRLLVADTSNNRVLLWTQFPTRNGQPADIVIGQPDFTSNAAATSASRLSAPYFVNSTGRQIFVSEEQNHRVTVWNQFPSAHGTPANTVLGQPDFTSKHQGDPAGGTTPSARSLYRPAGVLLAPPYLVVSDYGNNRLLVFETP